MDVDTVLADAVGATEFDDAVDTAGISITATVIAVQLLTSVVAVVLLLLLLLLLFGSLMHSEQCL